MKKLLTSQKGQHKSKAQNRNLGEKEGRGI
jgi:hypothetical protein